MKAIATAVLAAALLLAPLPAPAALAAFSSAAPGGAMPAPWRVVTLPKLPKHTRYDIVALDGASVLRVAADGSYANLLHPLAGERSQRLSWRWRVDQPIAQADLKRKDGDDVPARVCVLFDLPLDRLTFADRVKVELGRVLFDRDLPAASICYVWDRQLAPGTWLANAYTDRVQMLVLRRGGYGAWTEESRDLAADFARAFPHEARGGLPPLAAVGVSADGDNTGGSSLAYFGDLRLELR
jgi:anti-sigma factor RsiW